MAGVASLLRWRLDGIARGWWCGWAFLVIGVGQLGLEPLVRTNTVAAELATIVLGMMLIGRAVFGPAVDTTIRATNTLTMVAFGVAVAAGSRRDRRGLTAPHPHRAHGCRRRLDALLVLVAAVRQRRGHHDVEGQWIIPVAAAFGLAELLAVRLGIRVGGSLADQTFELAATGLACFAALGGLVRAAVHHRTRALREQVEREREHANHQRVEESFADRLHEMRSSMVAIEGGVATWTPDHREVPDATLRAALIAEIRRLRTLVNESPVAADVQVFDVEEALRATIALHRAAGQSVTLMIEGNPRALGRPAELAQIIEGLLTNAAKYAPRSEVRVIAKPALDEVSIRVEDQGPGIEPEYWDRVFERGFRVDPTAPTGGDGIGLAVARRLARSQDGDLWVEDVPDGGAAFVLSIPAAPTLRIVPTRAEDPPMDHAVSGRITGAQ